MEHESELNEAPHTAQPEAARFLAVLDKAATFYTFQTFDDNKDRKDISLARIMHGSLAQRLDELEKFNEQGAGIFVTINATNGNGRTANDINRVRAVFVDLDGSPLEPVLEAKLAPHIVVESSEGRFHAYWLVDDLPLDQFKRIQEALAERFDGDPSVTDLPRVLRLPGFIHRKSVPFVTRIVSINEAQPYKAALFRLPEEQPVQYAPVQTDTIIDPEDLTELLYTIDPDIGYASWFDIGCCLYVLVEDKALGFKIWDEWSSHGRKYKAHVVRGIWKSIAKKKGYAGSMFKFDAIRADAWWDKLTEEKQKEIEASVEALIANARSKYSIARQAEKKTWPTMGTDAYYGFAGKLVETIAPHSEADPVALLIQFLVCFGNAIGRVKYYRVESDYHYTNLFTTLVGETGGRKGISFNRIKKIFEIAEPQWIDERIGGGLSSGEGLIDAVRDPIMKLNKKGELEIVDQGVDDKRLLVVEPEFASILININRSGNNASQVIRKAWDNGLLSTMTRKSPLKATGAHVSIIGHVTEDELRAQLSRVDMANGFANRFLFVLIKRSKLLPFGGNLSDGEIVDLGVELRNIMNENWQHLANVSNNTTEMPVGMTPAARSEWAGIYPALTNKPPGLLGAITGRAEAQTIRIALVYAMLDRTMQIDPCHLRAAQAVWNYCAASALYIFGDSLGDEVADSILRALKVAGSDGMTRTMISDLFGRNQSSSRIDKALALLFEKERAVRQTRTTQGRPVEIWVVR